MAPPRSRITPLLRPWAACVAGAEGVPRDNAWHCSAKYKSKFGAWANVAPKRHYLSGRGCSEAISSQGWCYAGTVAAHPGGTSAAEVAWGKGDFPDRRGLQWEGTQS